MTENRKQHFIPEFYLTGFTTTGESTDFLHVLDQVTGKQWRARPTELAHQRDFYRVDLPDTDPNFFEKTFAAFEGQMADLLRRFLTSGKPPEGEDYSNLMFFLALMAVRIPRSRAQISKFINDIATNFVVLSVSTPERWEATRRRMVEQGHAEFENMTYEDARETFRPGRGMFDFQQTWHVGILLERAKAIFRPLADREWTFFQSDEEIGDFICSDHPLSLVWTNGDEGFYGPGHGLTGTDVSIPLSRNWAMLGRFEGEGGVQRATHTIVARINSRTAMFARQVYSGAEDFVWAKRDGKPGTSGELLAQIGARREKTSGP
jgi:hypothetical protein